MTPGEELPSLTVPITRTLVIAGAIASRDYQDVHHDAEAARAKGTPDIFMNILTTNGLVGRYVTDYVTGHSGLKAVLRKVSIRLGVPSYPGDVLVLTGRILSVNERTSVNDHASVNEHASATERTLANDHASAADRTIEISVVGTNRLGRHVTGRVVVDAHPFPSRATP
ncbi:acyl dehydratase [Streptomyces roseoverticillatus]|uniref:MaoC/PaaZ C-terminal domain-containing protein n=1 Tax=Streptomyces roseoverticillatus TaxID=66429 RepID=UPI001F2B7457|nr:MaoC/PaaZ C-terminal domain-containing protein [Streptomyces roseoverticillatus]MCF3100302.1 acyl dehydratase [Streptomyces roseoverticillatus]